MVESKVVFILIAFGKRKWEITAFENLINSRFR